jgi:hypothetical protein
LTKKTIPRFDSEDAERRFWAEHDTTDYFDWTKAIRRMCVKYCGTSRAVG